MRLQSDGLAIFHTFTHNGVNCCRAQKAKAHSIHSQISRNYLPLHKLIIVSNSNKATPILASRLVTYFLVRAKARESKEWVLIQSKVRKTHLSLLHVGRVRKPVRGAEGCTGG